MDTINSIEQQLVKMNKDLPKLPAGLTKWLAEYGWLLVLIGIVVTIMVLVSIVPLLLIAFGVSTFVGVGNLFSGYGFSPLIGTMAWLSLILSFINLLIVIVLEAKAVTPLKAKLHRGWQLIFMASLVSLAFSVVASIVTVQPSSLVINLLVYAVGFYILLQVRPHFLPHAKKTEKADKPAKPEFKAAKK